MRRNAFNEDLPLPPHGAAPLSTMQSPQMLPCGVCKTMTPTSTLGRLGAQCEVCYGRYLSTPLVEHLARGRQA